MVRNRGRLAMRRSCQTKCSTAVTPSSCLSKGTCGTHSADAAELLRECGERPEDAGCEPTGAGNSLQNETKRLREEVIRLNQRVDELEAGRDEMFQLRNQIDQLALELMRDRADKLGRQYRERESAQAPSQEVQLLQELLDRIKGGEIAPERAPPPNPPEFYTTEGFGEAIKEKRSEYTVRQWCNNGRINCEQRSPDRRWRIPSSEVERYNRHGLLPTKK